MSTDLSNYILKEIQLKNGQQLVLRKPIIEDAKRTVEYLNIVGGEVKTYYLAKVNSALLLPKKWNILKI